MRTLEEIGNLLEELRVEVATICNETKSDNKLSLAVFHIENAAEQIDDAVTIIRGPKMRRTDAEIMALLRDNDSVLNKARAQFSFGCARIEQAGRQRNPLSPVEMRRLEFEAVERIILAYNGEKI